MSPDYSSMWAKLRWAEELLVILDSEIEAWIDTRPYAFVTEFNRDGTCVEIVAKIKSDPLLVRWSLIFSDIIHSLRCALDQMVWAIARYESFVGTPWNKKIAFPIWSDFPSPKDRKAIRELSDSVRTAIDSVQPYNVILDPSLAMHPLSALAWIDNTNKHKLLMVARSTTAIGDIKIMWDGTEDPPQVSRYLGDIKDGAKLLTLTFKTPQTNVKCEIEKLVALIAVVYPIKSAQGADRDDYAALVDRLIVEIRRVVSVVTAAVV